MWAPVAASQERPAAASIFKPLKPGHKVTLSDKGAGLLEINLLNDGALGTHTVVEIGATHLVLEDIADISRRWIPVTAIRAVVWTRIPAGSPPSPPTR